MSTIYDKLPPKAATRVALTASAIAAAFGLDAADQTKAMHLAADYLAPILWQPDEPGIVTVRLLADDAARLAAKLRWELREQAAFWSSRDGWKESALAGLASALAGIPGGGNPGRRFWVCDDCCAVNTISLSHCRNCEKRAPHWTVLPEGDVVKLRSA